MTRRTYNRMEYLHPSVARMGDPYAVGGRLHWIAVERQRKERRRGRRSRMGAKK